MNVFSHEFVHRRRETNFGLRGTLHTHRSNMYMQKFSMEAEKNHIYFELNFLISVPHLYRIVYIVYRVYLCDGHKKYESFKTAFSNEFYRSHISKRVELFGMR